MRTEKRTEADLEAAKTRLLMTMMGHIGKSNAIGMGDLFEKVFQESWNHRINDTRHLRKLITEIRRQGIAICSATDRSGGGYWLSSAGSELEHHCRKMRARALKILSAEACLRKMTLAEMFGQMSLEFQSPQAQAPQAQEAQ
jgi:hypothetical protein